jgi:hypothetical protein
MTVMGVELDRDLTGLGFPPTTTPAAPAGIQIV